MQIECKANKENEEKIVYKLRSFLKDEGLSDAEISEVVTAVTEAISNVIVHAYPQKEGALRLEAALEEDAIKITIEDDGVGIKDVIKAKQPFFATKSELEHSGMGFCFMEEFMSAVDVTSQPEKGTCVSMQYVRCA